MDMPDLIREEVLNLNQEMITFRRDFHQHPELGMEERRTAQVIEDRLKDLGLKVTSRVGKTGVVGLLEGASPGKTVLLRADMDALPIQEENEVSYRSQNVGVMHACGHDGHMAILLTVARILSAHRQAFPGQIKFVFQPGEEGFGGARLMIEDGVLKDPPVGAAFALHLVTVLPVGYLATRPGPVMACMDSFTIKIKGKGGHAAKPEEGVDAILMTAQVISTLQSLISKEVSPTIPLIVHVGTIHGGSNFNVIAERVEMKGTVRTFDETLRASIPERMNRIIKGVTEALGGWYELDYDFGYPALVNDTTMTRRVNEVAAQVLGEERVIERPQVMSSEDFAFFLKEVPGCYFFVGAGNEKKGFHNPNHSAKFDFDEGALGVGAKVMAWLALTYLHST